MPDDAAREGIVAQGVVADDLRRPLRDLVGSQLPDVPVIAIRELDPRAELRVVGTVSATNPR